MGLSAGAIAGICVAVFAVAFAAGFLGGFYGKPTSDKEKLLNRLTTDADGSIQQRLIDEINSENLRSYLRNLSSVPHLAGTPADYEQAYQLKVFWEDVGLDRASLVPYEILLSYPDTTGPNMVVMYDEDSATVHQSPTFEPILWPEDEHPDIVQPYNGYSMSGQPRGPLVYVNYARVDDFKYLTETKNLNLSDCVCIARYGKLYRGNKAQNADEYGCAGLILYDDPSDYSLPGVTEFYPDSWYLPPSGVQRGSLKLGDGLGDPSTPSYPAIESAYRIDETMTEVPHIPTLPIGYGDAQIFLEQLDGDVAPDDWQGALDITYKIGPGFLDSNWSIQVFVSMETKMVTTYNAIGFIEGAIEPDRYVLYGNHRDSWVHGSCDPSSGTATMKEVSRALGQQLKNGWRPRRSILFCSWGAEEPGLIGSREWVENFHNVLQERAVAYINVDMSVESDFVFKASALPMMKPLIYEAAKVVPNPDDAEVAAGRTTMFDTWLHRTPSAPGSDLPLLATLGGAGSDYAPFIAKVGVTSADLTFTYDKSTTLDTYPLYHTGYDTFHMMESYVDPAFKIHQAMARVSGEMTRRLADSLVLPLAVDEMGKAIDEMVQSIESAYGGLITDHGAQEGLGFLRSARNLLVDKTAEFQLSLADVDTDNPVEVRRINDQIMNLERRFLDPPGLPGRNQTRNVAFAPSALDSYSGSGFPGLSDSLYALDQAVIAGETPDVIGPLEEAVKLQFSVVTSYLHAAVSSLEPPTMFT